MEKLTIDHLIPYSGHKLGLMDLSSLGHIPTTMILEGFDLHLKDKPLIAERTNWSLEEIKPILHPLSEFNSDNNYINFEVSLLLSGDCDFEDISYKTFVELMKGHYDYFGLIEKELAIDFNTLK